MRRVATLAVRFSCRFAVSGHRGVSVPKRSSEDGGSSGAGTVLRNRFSSAPSGVRLSEEGRSAASLVVPCRFSVQGTEVSASPYDPPRRGVEWSVRLFPAGSPLQGTKVTVQPNPKASLERLVPLVEFLAWWKLLPHISQWVLHTIEKGFRIQFGSRPPRFLEVLPTVVDPEQALVMEEEVLTLLQKEL
ncbi:hypothetical protein PO909_031826 [Leuciscus waleckii]